MSTNELHSLLSNITCEQILDPSGEIHKQVTHYNRHPPDDAISLNHDMSVKQACEILSDHKISSAPIADDNGKFIGQLDYYDLVAHIMQVLNEVPLADRHTSDWTIGEILDKASSTGHPLKSLQTHRPLVVIQKTAPILDVVTEFVRAKGHRVCIMDGDKFIGVVSQSTIAALVVDNFGLRRKKSVHWPLGEKSITELGLIEKKIVSVTEQNTVMEALFQMHVNNISSIAIIQSKTLRGSISMSDIKYILSQRNGWRRLFEHCGAFFKSVRLSQSLEQQGKGIMPNFTEKMVATRTHRVWVVKNDTEEIVGLVSLSSCIPHLLA